MMSAEERAARAERVACAEYAMSFALRNGLSHSFAMELANAILRKGETQ